MSTIKETIFSHAVALSQSGRLKSTIYAKGREVFILNQDKTILLNFTFPSLEPEIVGSVSFLANDYDSEIFKEQDGKIIFTTREGEYVRKKTCSVPGKTFSDIQTLYEKYLNDDKHNNKVEFNKNVLPLLDETLSHMEIFSENKKAAIIQRDIYTGSTIRIDRDTSVGFGLSSEDDIKEDFAPVGIRTNDFIALFNFCDKVAFYFGPVQFAFMEGNRFGMQGVISLCEYDEMGILTESKGEQNGREKPKIRGSLKTVDSTISEGSTKKTPKRRRG